VCVSDGTAGGIRCALRLKDVRFARAHENCQFPDQAVDISVKRPKLNELSLPAADLPAARMNYILGSS